MFENQKGSTSTTVVIIVIAIVVVLLVLGLVGCGAYYWWKNAQDNTTPVQTSTTQTSAQAQTSASTSATTSGTQAQTTESPQDVVTKFMRYTLGTIPGASIDYEAAKNLVSSELAQQIDGSFIPQSYCIQQGPDDVKVNVDSNDNTVAYITASTNYGGTWDKRWEFETVNGSGGWKIKYIKCIGTGQITQ